MLILIYGGSGSGKSAYAEELTASFEGKKYYLATMKSEGAEALERIERHRANREVRGFNTVERETDIGDAVRDMEGTVLLECLSNLLANEMFGSESKRSGEELCQKILDEINELKDKTANLIIVSNNIFEDGYEYEGETREYMEVLGRLNISLAKDASSVYEVNSGIPVQIK